MKFDMPLNKDRKKIIGIRKEKSTQLKRDLLYFEVNYLRNYDRILKTRILLIYVNDI